MKEIPLGKTGKVAIVDDSDYELVSQYKWACTKTNYPVRVYRTTEGKRTTQTMHSLIFPAPAGYEVDHIDRDSLNNTRANLRHATRAENNRNKRLPRNNTSGYRGVSWNKVDKKWQVIVQFQGKFRNLGRFTCILEAAKRYNQFAAENYGEFAVLNQIPS